MHKLFLIHVPKTAGSAMNGYISAQFDKAVTLTHLESNREWLDDTLNESHYSFLSGHIAFPVVAKRLSPAWKTIAVFRKPDEQVVSHLSWVRKLGDPGEEKRLGEHTKRVQAIVAKMRSIDLGNPSELRGFISWLEANDYGLFHGAQARYMSGLPRLTPKGLGVALRNLGKIDYVGITERIHEFALLLAYERGWEVPDTGIARENVNSNCYGLDLSKPGVSRALEALTEYDWPVYERAREVFIEKLHANLVVLEKQSRYRFSTVNLNAAISRLRELRNVGL